MKPIYRNGLVWWDETDIAIRQNYINTLPIIVQKILLAINPPWRFMRLETPQLTPPVLVLGEYSNNVFKAGDMALRPETTKGSYAVAQEMLNPHNKIKLPLCIMRLKEFWQLEFQCLYHVNTGADYKTPEVRALAEFLKADVEASDRLPSYSLETTDLIVNGMEIASISTRNDYAEDVRVLEVAVGLDRLVYQATNTVGRE